MAANHWTQRVRTPSTAPHELRDVQAVAHDLAQDAKRLPGRTGPLFHNVSEILLLGAALASSTLAILHLYKALSRQHSASHHEDRPQHAETGQHRPPQQDGDKSHRGHR